MNCAPYRIRLRLFAAFAVLAAGGCGDSDSVAPAPPAPPPASIHQQFVTDEQGRALILHGINVSGSAKDHPQRMPWCDLANCQRVQKDFGFNLVRFLIFWDAVEPEPGIYDDAYLDLVAERLQWFADIGVYVILDMHQDVYGKFSSTGKQLGFDGAPAWAARTDGLPHRIRNPWGLTYTQPGVVRAFDNLWNDSGPNTDLRQHYAAMWAHVAARFKDNPWVLGYNLMNEPFAGSAAAGNLAGFPFGDAEKSRRFEQTLFRSFYDLVIDAIRAVDADGWIFVEPLAFPVNNGGASNLPKLTDPRRGENRIVYFPHIYAVIPELNNRFDPADMPEFDSWVREQTNELAEWQTPMIVGEFGLPWDGNGDPLGYLQRILDKADELTSGWAYWDYSPGSWAPVTGDDLHESPNANVLVRAYPQRVAGRPIRYGYDPQTRVLELTFVDAPGVTGATEIYVPARRFYPSGWRLEMSDRQGTWASSWDANREVVSLTTPRTGGTHEVRVVPNP